MVGAVIPLVPKSTYDLSTLAAASTLSVPVARGIPIYSWKSGVMMACLYDNALLGDATVVFTLWRSAPSPDDPFDEFVGSRIAFLTFTSSSADKALYLSSLSTSGWPSHVDLYVNFANVSESTPGTITLAIDLLVRGRYFDRIKWAEDELALSGTSRSGAGQYDD